MTFIDDIKTRIASKDNPKKVCAVIYARDCRDYKHNLGGSQIDAGREYIANHPNIYLYRIYYDQNDDGSTTHHRINYINMLKDIEEDQVELIITDSPQCLNTDIHTTAALIRLLLSKKVAIYCLDGHRFCDIGFYDMFKRLADSRGI